MDTLPVSGPGWMLPLWEDEGCTLPGEPPKTNFKIFKVDAIKIREQQLEGRFAMRSQGDHGGCPT